MPTSETINNENPVRTLEELKNDALNQLNAIFMHDKNRKDYQSGQEYMIKLYHSHDSFLDYLAGIYGNQNWWIKLIMIGVTATLACLIGVAFHLIAVTASIILSLYIGIIALLELQYASMLEKDKHLAQDMTELEAPLSMSVKYISDVHKDLSSVLTSLCQLNIEQAESIDVLKTQIDQLKEKITQLTEINTRFNSSKDNLVDSTKKMAQFFEKTKHTLSELTTSLSENASGLKHTDTDLLNGATRLQKSHEHIQQLSESLTINQFDLSSMIKHLTALVNTMNVMVNMTTTLNEDARTKFNHSTHQTQASRADTASIVSDANRTIDKAMKQLNEYKTEKARIESMPSQTNTSNNTEAILKYVEELMEAENRSRESDDVSNRHGLCG